MSEIPGNNPGGGDDSHDKVVDEVLAELRAGESKLDSIRGASQTEFQRAVCTQVEILHGPEHAERLADRHNALCRGPGMVLAVEMLKGDRKQLELLREANQILWHALGGEGAIGTNAGVMYMQQVADKRGFFLMPYSVEKMQRILTSPDYIVAEVSGAHPALPDQIAPVADCQCHLPSIGDEANLEDLIDMPEQEGDEVNDPGLWRCLSSKPWSVGVVEDIACADKHPLNGMEAGDLGFAGMARRKCFHHIDRDINVSRIAELPGSAGIQHMVANIAVIEGIERPDGTRIILPRDFDEACIKNGRSMAVHACGRNPASLLYTLKHRRIPISCGPGEAHQYHAIVTWLGYIHSFSRFDENARAVLAERTSRE